MADSAGVGFVEILPRTEGFTAVLLTKVTTAMRAASAKVGGEATALGRTLSSGLAIPVIAGAVAAGAAVTKLASDYEDSIIRLRTLVGISATDVEELSDAVLRLATTLPQSPRELADALFFITSAGQRGEVAMETLRVSAQAAASGLGETKTVADAVTSAMNSYAKSGLTAAHATDILIKAVAEGKFEPAELAQNLGQVLPVAASLGVTFDQVAAAIASATRQGLAVSRAATGVRFLLTAFIKPSGQAVEQLSRVGISLENLQKRLREQGLLDTLQLLAKRFDLTSTAGKQAFAIVVGGARGLATANILVGENGAAIERVFDNIANSAGTAAEAFSVAQGTLTNRLKTLSSNFQAIGIQVGNILIPIISQLVSLLTVLARTVLLPLAQDFKQLLTVFLGYKVLTSFLPGLLLRLAIGFESLGAAVATERLLAFGEALQALRTPLLLIPGAFFVLAKVIGAKQAADLDRYRTTISKFGVESDKAQGAVKNLTFALARQQGISFRLPSTTEQRRALETDVKKTLLALDDEHKATKILETDVLKLQKQADQAAARIGGNVGFIAQAVGKSLTEFTGSLRGALAKSQTDVRAWGQFVGDTLSKSREFFSDWRDQAADSLTGVGDVLSTLAGTANLTAGKVLAAFEKAAKKTRDFTADLLVIGKTGGESGKQLASALLQLGPSAAGLADVVASSGKDMRDKLVGQFGDILAAGEGGASRLQTVLVGTLKDIRDILAQIAKRFGITVDLNDNASTKLDALLAKLRKLPGTTVIETQLGGGGGSQQQTGGEHGLFFAQRGGFVRHPTILTGEHSKQEAIVPLEDPHGIAALSKALREAGAGGNQTIIVQIGTEEVARHVTKAQRRQRILVGA